MGGNGTSRKRDDKTGEPRWTGPMERAFRSILEGNNLTQAAKDSGITRRTLSEWLMKDHHGFATELRRRRNELLVALRRKLLNAQTAATNTLLDLLKSDAEGIRLGAARTLLQRIPEVQLVESDDISDDQAEKRKSLSGLSTAELVKKMGERLGKRLGIEG